jgi:2-polyprenyl-6-methoxyphenol hydroxylase-like FAD-dependent oxidoreductase
MPRTQHLPYAKICLLPPLKRYSSLYMKQHLGQGANQSFEDIYHLTRLLGAHPGAAEDSATLEMVFTEYERARIPRSTMLIDTARKHGDNRVMEGVEACLTRNQQVRAFMSNVDVMAMYSELYGDLVEEGRNVMGPGIPSTGESRVD